MGHVGSVESDALTFLSDLTLCDSRVQRQAHCCDPANQSALWFPGHSGFSGYVQRVVPGIDGLRLQLGKIHKLRCLP